MLQKQRKQSPFFQKFMIKSAKWVIGIELLSVAAGGAFYYQYNNNPGEFVDNVDVDKNQKEVERFVIYSRFFKIHGNKLSHIGNSREISL